MDALKILYQDEALVAVDKPSGWFVHRSLLDPKVETIVLQQLRDQIGQYLYPIHRLDRPTSGVLIFALTEEAARILSKQFMEDRVDKRYLAIVRGFIAERGEIARPLKRQLDKIADQSAIGTEKEESEQSALTFFKRLKKSELPIPTGRYETSRYSLVELNPVTGRKHQLRRHCNAMAHPIIGDTRYGDLHHNRTFREHLKSNRLLLHALKLTFQHPITDKTLTITAPLDESWQQLFFHLGWGKIKL